MVLRRHPPIYPLQADKSLMVKFPFLRPDIAITPIRPDDVEALHHLHTKSFWHGWDQEAFQSFLHDPQVAGFAARPVGKPHILTGFVLARLSAGEGEILSIAVDPDYRKKGIGHALMDALLRYLHQERAQTLFLEVDEMNMAARALYKRFGFTEAGRRPAYYQSPGGRSDALILQRRLTENI